jgi:hypothetical protein
VVVLATTVTRRGVRPVPLTCSAAESMWMRWYNDSTPWLIQLKLYEPANGKAWFTISMEESGASWLLSGMRRGWCSTVVLWCQCFACCSAALLLWCYEIGTGTDTLQAVTHVVHACGLINNTAALWIRSRAKLHGADTHR